MVEGGLVARFTSVGSCCIAAWTVLACNAPLDPEPPKVQQSEIFFRYTPDVTQPPDFWSIRPDGTGLRRRLGDRSRAAAWVDLTRNGSNAVFNDGGTWVLSDIAGDSARLLNVGRGRYPVVFDPAGMRVAALERAPGLLRLWVMDLATMQSLRVTDWPNDDFVATRIHWWPSGDSVLVSGFDIWTNNAQLEVVRIATGERRRLQLVAVGPTGGPLALSPDGKHLAVVGYETTSSRIWLRIVDLVRSRYSEVTLPQPLQPSRLDWSPNQDAIVFDGRDGLQVFDIASQTFRVLFAGVGDRSAEPLWRPVP